MRPLPFRIILLAAPLGACALEPAIGPAMVVGAASLVFTGKTPVDHVAGWATGQDCSSVRWERHGPWCAPPAGPPPAQPYCTQSRGSVDCWTEPPPGAPLRGLGGGAIPQATP